MDSKTSDPKQARSGESASAGSTKTVLVVDDETDILDSITALLEVLEACPRVMTARDGKEALEIMERESVDLLVTDYRMPRMDGIELMKTARETNPDLPLILITAFPDPSLEETAKNTLGVIHFIRKPFEPSEIIEAVEKGLQ